MATHPPAGAHSDLTHLVVRRALDCTPNQIAWALRAARAWLGPEVESPAVGVHRYQATLRLKVRAHPSILTLGKAAYVDIGRPQELGGSWEAEISWRASSLAPLFPVFSGVIVAREAELALSGWYAPPGGEIGRAADHALLHVAARRTGGWFLDILHAAALRAREEQP